VSAPRPRSCLTVRKVALASWLALVSSTSIVSCSTGTSDDLATDSTPSATGSVAREESLTRVEPPPFVLDIATALAAVEEELGAPQEYFEVTANAQLTNIFVAVDGGAAAVAYVFVDGELQSPAPKLDGATGETFTAADVDFEPTLLLAGVTTEVPTAAVEAVSVYGNEFGASYVIAAVSPSGGVLDIEVGPNGNVLSVTPT
jgi:hypothetical protein